MEIDVIQVFLLNITAHFTFNLTWITSRMMTQVIM